MTTGVFWVIGSAIFLVGVGGTVGLAIELYPWLKEPGIRWGVIAILLPLFAMVFAVAFIGIKLRRLEREEDSPR